jgi:hypothetical protein
MTKDEALGMAIEVFDMYGNKMNSAFADEAYHACKEALAEQPTGQPTRLEVIDANGRTYTNWKVKDMEFSYQDDGKTLKIFIKESE